MNSLPEISIIIPSYNVEEYIGSCLDSIVNQSFTDYEIIVVDDGSTDKTKEIISRYIERYSNIVLITQKNSGQSVARNRGIEVAKGKFIVFVDSDDWFTEKTSLQSLYSTVIDKNPDFVQAGFCYVNGESISEYRIRPEKDLFKNDILINMLRVDNLYTSPWAKIYSTKFIKDNNIRFIEGLVNEDTAFSIEVASYANKVSFLSKNVYSSREREGSTSRTSFKRMFKTMHEVLHQTRIKLISIGRWDYTIHKYYEARYVRSMLYNLFQSAQRNSFSIFTEDYNYCMNNTSYKKSLKFSKYLPLPHRIFSTISTSPFFFYSMAKFIRILGFKMH